jgi:ATP-dependent RNA helicase HelY
VTGPVAPGRAFELDRFQVEAIAALDRGENVLVAAPTGSGKTVVAEHAVALALASGSKAFYTAPIKALSNQKYRDLVEVHGADRVGLLTGDTSRNPDSPVVVMTTEVLRNMLYRRAPALEGLRWVVLDEVHFLQDEYRGPVWEEVMIHLAPGVGLVCLSATVSNADELGEWITTVRGPTAVVLEERRPVRLTNHFMVESRDRDEIVMIPTLVGGKPNRKGQQYDAASPGGQQRGRQRGRQRRPFATPRRLEVVDRLAAEGLLPAIYFIFSRAACDDAVRSCTSAGLRLTSTDERSRIREIVEAHTAGVDDADLAVLGYDRWLHALESGVAAHHAGMVPPFKEAVEACFVEGLVRVVFATETLALGINMPARTVVIEKLTKYNGEGHEFLTPAQYTQLTGRAGRRGIDPEGHAVVLWSPFVPFGSVADLVASRRFVLTSAFRPTYNMAANLVRRYDPDQAHRLLNLSFAQYQADRAVVRAEIELAQRTTELDTARRALTDAAGEEAADELLSELDDGAGAAGAAGATEDAGVVAALAALVPGQVVVVPPGRRAARLVRRPTRRRRGDPPPRALRPAEPGLPGRGGRAAGARAAPRPRRR